MKKFLSILGFSVFLFSSFIFQSQASTYNVNAYLFTGIGCPHCAKEVEFFDSIKNKYPNLNLITYEVYYNNSNLLLLQEVATYLGEKGGGIPFLIIGDKSFAGFGEYSSPPLIENRILECTTSRCPDQVGQILGVSTHSQEEQKSQDLFITEEASLEEKEIDLDTDVYNQEQEDVIAPYVPPVIENTEEETSALSLENNEAERIMKLPFLGEKDIYKLSLPVLSIFIGILDGFNPCAMWVLIFLISLLLGMKNRKRMWTLGITFIVASASVYFIFMSAWLNLILFLGIVLWVRLLIAILALVGGGYSLKKFFTNKEGTCEIVEGEKEQKIFNKLKRITKENNLWLAIGGIILLAFMVNLVELICSAGLPAVFTQVLAMNNLSTFSYYGYILLYIFFFMLDDLVVFVISMVTLRAT